MAEFPTYPLIVQAQGHPNPGYAHVLSALTFSNGRSVTQP
jgi:hypothetical protein